MEELLKEFAENLSALRRGKDMSLRELSNATQISRAALHEYERGLTDPSMTNLIKIARYFNKSVSWLIGEVKEDYLPAKTDKLAGKIMRRDNNEEDQGD